MIISTNKNLIQGIVAFIRHSKSSEIHLGRNIIFRDKEDGNYFLSEIKGKEYWLLFVSGTDKREGKSFIEVYDDNREKTSLLEFTIDQTNFKVDNDEFTLTQNRGITIRRKIKGLNEIFNKRMVEYGFDHNKVITKGRAKKPNFSPILKDILFWIEARTSIKLELEEKYRDVENRSFDSEEEIGDIETKTEGGQKVVMSIRIERSRDLRDKAIDYHGQTCKVCSFNFQKTYGEWGRDFIEVHHLIPLSEYGERETDIKKDLTVLCSNCHRMIHKKKNLVLTIEELRACLKIFYRFERQTVKDSLAIGPVDPSFSTVWGFFMVFV